MEVSKDIRISTCLSSSQIPSGLAGQFGVCGWEDGWVADSQWPQAQRRRHRRNGIGSRVNKDGLQRKVSTANLAPPRKLLHEAGSLG